MKKVLLAGLLAFTCWEVSYAVVMDSWVSSNTATADTIKNLCPGTSTLLVNGSTQTWGNRGVFHGVCINTGAVGSLSVWNSSAPVAANAPSPIAVMNTATAQPCSIYDVGFSSGLTYTNSATANITLLYQCY